MLIRDFLLCQNLALPKNHLPVVLPRIKISEIESTRFCLKNPYNSKVIYLHSFYLDHRLCVVLFPGPGRWSTRREDPSCWTNLTVDNIWSFILYYRSPLPLLQWRKSLYKFASISPERDLCVWLYCVYTTQPCGTSVAATRSRHRQHSSTQYTTIVLQCWELAVNSSTVL